MTTKELINQYVTAHADNRWMDASELETLLTEFAEKLKEPTSDDLEQAAIDYDSRRPALYGEDDEGDYVEYIEVRKDAFIAVAEWQKEQFEKNRLAHCDAQTEEEAEVESDFVMGIIENEHRQPTFDDAIKYGMRLQREQMMKGAIEGWVARDECGDIAIFSDKPHRDLGLGMWTPARHAFLFPRKDEYPDVTWNSEPQKVKVIIIKE